MSKSLFRLLISLTLLLATFSLKAQDFMLQGFYWDYPNQVGIIRWGANYLNYVPELQEAGFNYIWLPPMSRSSSNLSGTGYDVMDYYDLGEYGGGATHFGTRRDVNNLITSLKNHGIHPVADMIFNQRTGGQYEDNPAVQGWVENMNINKINAGDQPYPSDRFRCYILLGDTSGNDAGTYYVKFRSASQSSNFYGKPYTVRMWTKKVPLAVDSTNDSYEFEPNNGGDCGDTSNFYILGSRKYANIDAGGCGIDEFRLVLDTSMYYTTGDTLFISMENTGAQNLGDFADQYIYGIWNANLSTNIFSQIKYQTRTDFTHMASGKGAMNYMNFKPNGNPTQLSGDWDAMLFFYDVDQTVTSTQNTLIDWTQWMVDTIGIEGMRMDAVKNYTPAMVSQLLNSLNAHGSNPKMVVGEYYDYNPSSIMGWINNVTGGMTQAANDSIHVRAFDFGLRGALKAASDQFGYDVRGVFNSGIVNSGGGSKNNSITWVSNHDFRDSSQIVVHNPELAYAYILTNNQIGIPCVYHPDFFGTNFMKGRIKALMHANTKYISDATSVDYLNNYSSSYATYFVKGYATTTLAYQLNGSKQVIVAINYAGDSLDMYQHINMTNVAVGDTFTDIFGVADTLTTITPNSELHVILPPRSFAVYVKGNLKDSLITFGDTLFQNPVGITPEPVANEDAIRVYPNPFSNLLNIDFGKPISGALDIDVWDVTGKQVYVKHFADYAGNTFQFDPGAITNGFYLLRVNANGVLHHYKLLKH